MNDLAERAEVTRADRTEWMVDFHAGKDSNEPPVDAEGNPGADRKQVERGDGNVYGSLLENGKHSPVLDLDKVGARLVPSVTPGNFHLYLENVEVEWEAFERLLLAMAECGIIEQGYANVSIARKGTFVRKPGVPKGTLPQL